MKFLLFLLILIPSYSYSSNILYSIEKDGKTSYILGTVHSVQAEAEDVHPKLPSIISKSRIALFEIVTAFDRIDGFADLLEEAELLGLSNSNGISPGAAKKIDTFLSSLDEANFGHIKNNWKKVPPGLLIVFLQMALSKAQFEAYESIENEDDSFKNPLSYADGHGIDVKLKDQIQNQGTPVYALDGDQVYLRVLMEHSTVRTLADFAMKNVPKVAAADTSKIKREKDLPKEWKIPDRHVPDRETANGFYLDDNPEDIFRVFNDHNNLIGITANKRNEAWARKLLAEVKLGGAFIVVGLGHLHLSSRHGRSLIQILEDDNFKVTAIPKFAGETEASLVNPRPEISCKGVL